MTRYEELAEQYGTPLYVYDLDRITEARRDLRTALPDEVEVYYALKANPHPQVAGALRDDNGPECRAEISSVGELAAALTAGYRAADCLYTGPGKTDTELDEAIGKGVRTFSVESFTDLQHIGAAALRHDTVARCLLRINSATASATTSIRMTGTPSQFGIDSETLADATPDLLAVPGTRVVGMHFFPLSNARDEDSLIGEFQHTIETAARLAADHGIPLEFLDIGGGFAHPYGAPGDRPVYRQLRAALTAALDAHLPRWREGAPQIAVETGRYQVSGSGALLSRVVNTKVSRGRKFVVLDAGINTFGGMSGLGRLLPVAVEPETTGAADAVELDDVASLAGPLCTPGDLLGREIALPRLEPGDLVTVPNAGAYGVTASLLMFLGRPAPVEVVVQDGRVVSASRLEHHRSPATRA
ncbi:type III PLP-dependent enzyme [Streptomyces liliifuscus]|uniref:Type III PLP-dependent enzyme n=1 Tax=Streptomyces liliifuscus TaxID=2797636 RepID=A0A7T7L271_9ACTN|nr:type III PLP-dependent enzyme [Streptomyces liliifuscus]QQM45070.1 type III PLP-dependent enzyme [Streptomyces liliifuscus]